jgi:hypothetical protein
MILCLFTHFVVFNTISSLDCISSTDGVINNQLVGADVGGSGHCQS